VIDYTTSGSTAETEAFLKAMAKGDYLSALDPLAQEGVEALRSATSIESGLTGESWTYEILEQGGGVTIWWSNTNVVDGFNVAIGLQYGHGTGTGGWIEGYDYINPAIKPIFDQLADQVWKEVQNA
jgi:hypothetical protein